MISKAADDFDELSSANRAFAAKHPGESGRRQPVHVVYGGAHLFKSDTCSKLGKIAARALSEYARDAEVLAEVTGIALDLAPVVHQRIERKLQREPIEDYRIDFEDGYGIRSDTEEDTHATQAAIEMADASVRGVLPPFCGFRIKPLNEELKQRSLRTLNLFLTSLLDRTGGKLPANFAVTLPKITVPQQVTALTRALERFPGVNVELMMETPQALLHIGEWVDLTEGRCVGVHFGPYDYSASLGITAAHQSLRHPVCDFARGMMQVALAGRGLALSDGPATLMPIAPHRGEHLTAEQQTINRAVVHRAWKLHYDNVRHALLHGYYEGWDLHPAQFCTRYAAVYSFFLEGLKSASERLRNFINAAAQATRIGEVFDDAATGQGLLNYFLRAISCGAIPEEEIPELTGLTLEQLRTASFAAILKNL